MVLARYLNQQTKTQTNSGDGNKIITEMCVPPSSQDIGKDIPNNNKERNITKILRACYGIEEITDNA